MGEPNFNTYNPNEAKFEIYCQQVMEDYLKDFNIKYLNENGENYGFDAMLTTRGGVEIPLEYQYSPNWKGDEYPKHWRMVKWYKDKAIRKYKRFKNGNWRYGFFLTFNANLTVFYIASFDKIIQMDTEFSWATRSNGSRSYIESYYCNREDGYIFKVEDINEVLLNVGNPEVLNKLRLK